MRSMPRKQCGGNAAVKFTSMLKSSSQHELGFCSLRGIIDRSGQKPIAHPLKYGVRFKGMCQPAAYK